MPLYLDHPDHEPGGGKKKAPQHRLDDMSQAELDQEFADTLRTLETQSVDTLASEGAAHKEFADFSSAVAQYRQVIENQPDLVYKGELANAIRSHLASANLTLTGPVTALAILTLLDGSVRRLDQRLSAITDSNTDEAQAKLHGVKIASSNLRHLVNDKLITPEGDLAQ